MLGHIDNNSKSDMSDLKFKKSGVGSKNEYLRSPPQAFDDPPPPYARDDPRRKIVEELKKPLIGEDLRTALQTLSKYDIVIIVDDSGSMNHRDIPGKKTRWNKARTVFEKLVKEAAKYDTDGITIHFLNRKDKDLDGVKKAKEVKKAFQEIQPKGPTPIGARLHEIMGMYFSELQTAYESGGVPHVQKTMKPVNYLILTDGCPTDRDLNVFRVLRHYAKVLEDGEYPSNQVGVQFVQIGSDARATNFLKALDNDAQNPAMGLRRDIVDTTPYVGKLDTNMILKVMLGGINRRVDRYGAEVGTMIPEWSRRFLDPIRS